MYSLGVTWISAWLWTFVLLDLWARYWSQWVDHYRYVLNSGIWIAIRRVFVIRLNCAPTIKEGVDHYSILNCSICIAIRRVFVTLRLSYDVTSLSCCCTSLQLPVSSTSSYGCWSWVAQGVPFCTGFLVSKNLDIIGTYRDYWTICPNIFGRFHQINFNFSPRRDYYLYVMFLDLLLLLFSTLHVFLLLLLLKYWGE